MSKPEITGRREIRLGETLWTVTEYDTGRHILSSISSGQLSFVADFTAKEWREFELLVTL